MREESTVLTPLKDASVAMSTIFFLIFVCSTLTGLIGWTIWQERFDLIDESTVTVDNMARSLAQQADDTIRMADTTLVGLSERVVVDGTSPEALDRLHRLLVLLVQERPLLQGLFVLDKNGDRRVNSVKGNDERLNRRDRDYFQYHFQHADTGPHIGVPFQRRTNGEWVIPLSRRLNDKNGEFTGVIVATLAIRYFTDFYKTFDIGERGEISMIMDNGILITQQPPLSAAPGKDLSATPFYRLYRARNGSGVATVTSAQDGVERLTAFRRLAHYPIFVTAALSKYEILSSWRELLVVRGLITVAIVLLFIAVGARLVRQIKLRLRAEQEAKSARDALQELNVTLERLAQQDGLTGLANRRKFDETIDYAMRRAKRSSQPLAMILIDVDYFKKFNDLYGHVAGDECLRQVARIIKSCEKRSSDLAARYGGEEFAVLLPDTDYAGALVVAEAIREAIRALKIEHRGNASGVVTISAGIDVVTSFTERSSPTALIEAADKALYEAKSAGRDRIHAAVN